MSHRSKISGPILYPNEDASGSKWYAIVFQTAQHRTIDRDFQFTVTSRYSLEAEKSGLVTTFKVSPDFPLDNATAPSMTMRTSVRSCKHKTPITWKDVEFSYENFERFQNTIKSFKEVLDANRYDILPPLAQTMLLRGFSTPIPPTSRTTAKSPPFLRKLVFKTRAGERGRRS